jgi:hypothetical protein
MRPVFYSAPALLIAALLASAASAASAPDCLLQRLREFSPDLPTAYEQLQNIPPALVRGTQVPSWADFDALTRIASALREARKNAKASGELAELEASLIELERSVPDAATPEAKSETATGAQPGRRYAPTEYELKQGYQQALRALNRELPPELTIQGTRLAPDPRRPRLREQARKLVAGLEERFAELYPTTGYSTPKEFQRALEAAGPRASGISEALASEQVEIAMYAPTEVRAWAPRVGFQNQHVTGSSRGWLVPEARNHVEAGYLGKSFEEVAGMDGELKPKYATVFPKSETGYAPGRPVWKDGTTPLSYGDDVYVFKLDRVRDRLTVTTGDSFNRADGWNPDRGHQTSKARSWDQLFIPWKDRALLAPDLMAAEDSHWNVPYGSSREDWTPAEKEALRGYRKSYDLNRATYPEAQIFGPLTLDDVETFQFRTAPPSGEFLNELRKRHIRIRDGRQSPPVVWIPEEP